MNGIIVDEFVLRPTSKFAEAEHHGVLFDDTGSITGRRQWFAYLIGSRWAAVEYGDKLVTYSDGSKAVQKGLPRYDA